MLLKKLLMFLVFVVFGQPHIVFAEQRPGNAEEERYFQANQILEEFYNHFDSVEENAKAKKAIFELIRKYPDEPYLYNVWALTEWVLIGHELGIKIDEQKDIVEIPIYLNRVSEYHKLVDEGISLTDGKDDQKSLLLRAAFFFDKAKFIARFEGGLSGLRRADKESANSIKIIIKIFSENGDFCPGYLIPGITRFGLAAKTEPWSFNRLIVRTSSKTYNALYDFDSDVFNKNKSLQLLERMYYCKGQEIWFEKFWLESAFFLASAYGNYRKDLKITEELQILKEKEIPLLRRLAGMFPGNNDLAKKFELARLRQKILENYFTLKK